jgi:hypothetical protein
MAISASYEECGGLLGRRFERRAALVPCPATTAVCDVRAAAACEALPVPRRREAAAGRRAIARAADWRAVIAAWAFLLLTAAAGFWTLGRLDRAGPLPDTAVGLHIPIHQAGTADDDIRFVDEDDR